MDLALKSMADMDSPIAKAERREISQLRTLLSRQSFFGSSYASRVRVSARYWLFLQSLYSYLPGQKHGWTHDLGNTWCICEEHTLKRDVNTGEYRHEV